MSSSNPAHILLRRNSNVKDVVASPLVSANGGPEDIAYSNTPADYDLGQPIGYGSSAVVYIAKYKPANKRVAIKLIDLDQFERNQIDELRREIQIMSLSRHPNLLPVLGSFVHDSKLYIVTPFLSAGSCLDIMKTAYPNGLEESCIATILKQSLQGLEYLHKNGLIHRDVKAGNLLMDDDGLVQLADFGVSSSLMDTGERRGVRKTFVGTPCWMAPEVMEQTGYDHRADIWSFGITALELATGHAPFSKYPPLKVLMLTLQNDPPTLDREQTAHKYSKSFKDMIDSCLQKDPTKRPSAERLLNHAFFKLAPKRRQHLITDLIQTLPPVTDRPHNNRLLPKKTAEAKGVSWDFTSEIEALARSPPAGEDSSIAFSLSSISRLDPTSEKTPAPMTAPQNPSEVKEIKIGRFSVTESQAQPVTGDSAPVSPNMAPSASHEGSVVEGARPSRFTVVAADQPRHSASPPMSIQGSDKRGRFEVSSVDRGHIADLSSMSPSPASSPSTTMARGSRFTTSVVSNQPPGAYSHPSQGPTPPFAPGSAGLDAAIVNERLDTILQQNQQQRALLNELISLMKGSGMNVPDSIVQSAVLPSSGPPVTSAFSTVTPQALEAQVSSMIRENEERKRENELLRREYDTLRRETELLLQVQAQLRQQNEALRREQADRVQSQATIPATEGDGADAGVSSGEGGEA